MPQFCSFVFCLPELHYSTHGRGLKPGSTKQSVSDLICIRVLDVVFQSLLFTTDDLDSTSTKLPEYLHVQMQHALVVHEGHALADLTHEHDTRLLRENEVIINDALE